MRWKERERENFVQWTTGITFVCKSENRRIHMAFWRILSISYVWFMAQFTATLSNSKILCNSLLSTCSFAINLSYQQHLYYWNLNEWNWNEWTEFKEQASKCHDLKNFNVFSACHFHIRTSSHTFLTMCALLFYVVFEECFEIWMQCWNRINECTYSTLALMWMLIGRNDGTRSSNL